MPTLELSRFLSKPLTLAALCLCAAGSLLAGALNNASLRPLGVVGNDIVYDPLRNVFYLSVPSSAGFPYGNSVLTINPDTAQVIGSTFVGSEPNRMALAADGSRLYVGLDGAYGFCWWEPATDTVSEVVNFTVNGVFGPSVAGDLVVAPNDPHTVIFSKDATASTASGALEIFRDRQSVYSLGAVYGPDSLVFSDATTLFGRNYDSVLLKWTFKGTSLTELSHDGKPLVYASKLKFANGFIFSDFGAVVSPTTQEVLGTFAGRPTDPVMVPETDGSVAYFLGYDTALHLVAYDRPTFLKIDSLTFATEAARVRSLAVSRNASYDGVHLGYTRYQGAAGIIAIPAAPPTVTGFMAAGAAGRLRWSSEAGRSYRVQGSSDLVHWKTLVTVQATQAESSQSVNIPEDHGFYRVLRN